MFLFREGVDCVIDFVTVGVIVCVGVCVLVLVRVAVLCTCLVF